MFDIRILPSSERGPDGQRLGSITVGNFTERFACYDINGVLVDDLPTVWKRRLYSLTLGAPAIALVHDPRFAWIVYREGNQCFVQQRFAPDGDFGAIPARKTVTEDGVRISEWSIGLQAIMDFSAASFH
jgi:hypothetical protein